VLLSVLVLVSVTPAAEALARGERLVCRDGVLAEHQICDADGSRNRSCAFSFACPLCWPQCKIRCEGAIVRVGHRQSFRLSSGETVTLRCRRHRS